MAGFSRATPDLCRNFRADGGIHNIDERIVWVEEFWIYGG
jgi:hypothetical protein